MTVTIIAVTATTPRNCRHDDIHVIFILPAFNPIQQILAVGGLKSRGNQSQPRHETRSHLHHDDDETHSIISNCITSYPHIHSCKCIVSHPKIKWGNILASVTVSRHFAEFET